MKRGAQEGNQNARRSHTRLVVSFDGAMIELICRRMTRIGYDSRPTDKQIKEYIKDVIENDIVKSEQATS